MSTCLLPVVVKSGGGLEALLEKPTTNIFVWSLMLYFEYFKLYSVLLFILPCNLFSFLICICFQKYVSAIFIIVPLGIGLYNKVLNYKL